MIRPTRAPLVVLALGVALFASGCGSNNAGKIEGKWKVTTIPGANAKARDALDKMGTLGMYLSIEFQTGGQLTIGIAADNPQMLEMLKAFTPPGQKTSWTAKYRLLAGDSVEIYEIPPEMQSQSGMFSGKDRARVKVRITGDNMEMTEATGTAQLVRVNPAGPAAPKDKDHALQSK